MDSGFTPRSCRLSRDPNPRHSAHHHFYDARPKIKPCDPQPLRSAATSMSGFGWGRLLHERIRRLPRGAHPMPDTRAPVQSLEAKPKRLLQTGLSLTEHVCVCGSALAANGEPPEVAPAPPTATVQPACHSKREKRLIMPTRTACSACMLCLNALSACSAYMQHVHAPRACSACMPRIHAPSACSVCFHRFQRISPSGQSRQMLALTTPSRGHPSGFSCCMARIDCRRVHGTQR